MMSINLLGTILKNGFFGFIEEDEALPYGAKSRMVVASKKIPGRGYGGISFWIAEGRDIWFVGLWSGRFYQLESEKDALEFSLTWLSYDENTAPYDIPNSLKEKFNTTELVP